MINQGIILPVPQFNFRPGLLGVLPLWIHSIEEGAVLGCSDLVLTDLVFIGDPADHLVVQQQFRSGVQSDRSNRWWVDRICRNRLL